MRSCFDDAGEEWLVEELPPASKPLGAPRPGVLAFIHPKSGRRVTATVEQGALACLTDRDLRQILADALRSLAKARPPNRSSG